MRRSCSKYGLFFVFAILVVIMAANITYADSVLPQSNEDIPSSWAEEEIVKAIEAKLLPEGIRGDYRTNINREEFSQIAVNLYEALVGKNIVQQGENPFTDTQNTYVIIANELGIVKGVGGGRFAPKDKITRQEISVMLYRTLKAARPGYDYSTMYGHVFVDQAAISSWARDAVSYLYKIGVINGVGDNQFEPAGNTSREQAAVLANRIYEKALTAKTGLTVSRDGTSRRESVMKSKLEVLISQEMGKPYQWGAEGPDSYDCSGLVYYIYGKLGISLPRVARDQAKVGTYVAKDDLKYGDLVFFARDGENVHHVGIYVGEGMMVHAPQTGDVVKKTNIMSGYYQRVYYSARRVIN